MGSALGAAEIGEEIMLEVFKNEMFWVGVVLLLMHAIALHATISQLEGSEK